MTEEIERLRAELAAEREAKQSAVDEAEKQRDAVFDLLRENKRLAKSRDRWGQRYNKILTQLRVAVMTDTDYIKAVDEACEKAMAERDALRTEADTMHMAAAKLRAELAASNARIMELERIEEVYRNRKPIVYSPDAQAMSDRAKAAEAERDALRAVLAKIRRDYSSAFMPEDAARIDAALKEPQP